MNRFDITACLARRVTTASRRDATSAADRGGREQNPRAFGWFHYNLRRERPVCVVPARDRGGAARRIGGDAGRSTSGNCTWRSPAGPEGARGKDPIACLHRDG